MTNWEKNFVPIALALIMVMSALVPIGLLTGGAPSALTGQTAPVSEASKVTTQVTPSVVHTSTSTPTWNFPSPSSVSCLGAHPVFIAGVEIPNGTAGIHWIGGNNGSGVKTFPKDVIVNITCSFPVNTHILMRYNLTDENPASTIYVVNSSLKMEQQAPTAAHGYRDISTVGSFYIYNSTVAANNTTGNLHWSTDANGTASLYILLGTYGALTGASACPTTWQPVFYANNAKLQNNTSVDWGSAYGVAGTVLGGTNPSWPTCTANSDFYVVDSSVNGTLATGSATSEVLNTVITEVGQKDTSTTPWKPVLLDANVTSESSKLTTFNELVNGLLVKTYYPVQYLSSTKISTTQCPQAALNNTSVGIIEVCAFSKSPFAASPPLNSTVIDNVTLENVNATATDALVSLAAASTGYDSLSYITLPNIVVNITSLTVKVHGYVDTAAVVENVNQNSGFVDELATPTLVTGLNVTSISSVATAGFGITTNTYTSTQDTLPGGYVYVSGGSVTSFVNVGMVVPFTTTVKTGIEVGQYGSYVLVDNATVWNTNIPLTGSIQEIGVPDTSVYFHTVCTSTTCPGTLASLVPAPSSLVNDTYWPMVVVAQSHLKQFGIDATSGSTDQIVETGGLTQTNVLWDNVFYANSTYAITAPTTTSLDVAHIFYDTASPKPTSITTDYLYGNTITVVATGGVGVVQPGYYLNLTANTISMTANDNNSANEGLLSVVDDAHSQAVLSIHDNTISGTGKFVGKNPPSLTDWFTGTSNGATYIHPPIILFSSNYGFDNTLTGITTIEGISGNTISLTGPAEDFNGITWGAPGSFATSTSGSPSGTPYVEWFGGYLPQMAGTLSSYPMPQMSNLSAIPVDGAIGKGPIQTSTVSTYNMQVTPPATGPSSPDIVNNVFNDTNNSVFWTAGSSGSFAGNGACIGALQVNATWTVGFYYTSISTCPSGLVPSNEYYQNPVVVGPNTWSFDSSSFFTYESPDLMVEGTKVPQMMMAYCQSGDNCLSTKDSTYYNTLFVDATASAFVAAPVSSEVSGSTSPGEDAIYGSSLYFDIYYAPGHAWSLSNSKYGTVQSSKSTLMGAGGDTWFDSWWIVNQYFTVDDLGGTSAPSMTWSISVDGTTMYSFANTASLGLFVQSFNANATSALAALPISPGYLPGSDMEVVLTDAPTSTLILPSDIVASTGTALWSPIYFRNAGMLDGNVTIPISAIDAGMKTSFPQIQIAVPAGFIPSFTLPSQGTAWDLGTPSVPVFYLTSPVQFFPSPGAVQGAITFNLAYLPTKVLGSTINSTADFGVSSVQKKLLGFEYFATWAGKMLNLPNGVSSGQVVYDVVAGDAAYNSTSHWAKPDGTLNFYTTDINFVGLQVGASDPYALFVNSERVPTSGSQFFATDPSGNFSYTMTPTNTTYVVEALFTQATGLLWYQTSTFLLALIIIVVAAAALGVLWLYDRAGRSRPRKKSRRAMA